MTPVQLQTFSSLAIWIPLLFALVKLKTGDIKFRLFFVFLLFGALVDGFGLIIYYFLPHDLFNYHGIFQLFYLWFEALFFVWICFYFLEFNKRNKWRNILLIGFSGMFITEFILRIVISIPNNTFFAFIHSFFLVTSSFLSAFALLRIAEKRGEILRYSWFWILSGIFIYCFSSFFVDMLSYTAIGRGIWSIRVLANIIQYGFFVVGLLKINNAQWAITNGQWSMTNEQLSMGINNYKCTITNVQRSSYLKIIPMVIGMSLKIYHWQKGEIPRILTISHQNLNPSGKYP